MCGLKLIKSNPKYYLFRVIGEKIWFIFVDRSELKELLERDDFYFVE